MYIKLIKQMCFQLSCVHMSLIHAGGEFHLTLPATEKARKSRQYSNDDYQIISDFICPEHGVGRTPRNDKPFPHTK